jgi:hypothetical protein
MQNPGEILLYQTEDGQSRIDVRLVNETVWLSAGQMADLFQRDKSTISRHIQNAFEENELDRSSVVAFYATTAADGKTYQVEHFNLDVVISVGYRVKSHRGVQFRQWAKEGPDILKDRDLSRALFGALKEELGRESTSSVVREDPVSYGSPQDNAARLEQALAEAACGMEDIIRRHAVVRWRENIDAQNRIRNDLDDFLYDLQTKKGVQISFDQMDAIIEAVIRIAIHRSDDI